MGNKAYLAVLHSAVGGWPVQEGWKALEKAAYGAVQPRAVDNFILALILALLFLVSYLSQKTAEQKRELAAAERKMHTEYKKRILNTVKARAREEYCGKPLFYRLENKETEPGFKFLVKVNKADAGYFLYNSVEEAMEKARVLSLTEYPISLIYEPVKDSHGEWVMRKTFLYIDGKPAFNDNARNELHVKFYLESGEWLNPDPILDQKALERICDEIRDEQDIWEA